MGQYYKAVILGKNKKSVNAWFDMHGWAKLTEHAFIGNNLCNAVENYLRCNPQRLVWAGDYADPEKGSETNLYDRCTEKKAITEFSEANLPAGLLVINHTKKEYYARDEVKSFRPYWSEKNWTFNPIAIMTAEGNGRGGGDYRCGVGREDIGRWARDLIEVNRIAPDGYKKINPYFKED